MNSAGEWKLGGVDYVGGNEASPVVGKVPSSLHQLDPPEMKTGGKGSSKWSSDTWLEFVRWLILFMYIYLIYLQT